ncbi:Abortive infection protein [Candidatus Omnitrophus magneticus]|uniref:Abortive infection protein n=1 Tax=Candidatus Omnitrophus magneticus TaxID=1609969 RepID=A0A0F0CSG1_9BACT|nr:Abortive infection protein [Candidatus Omnitrophus magneticus]
MLKKTVRLLWRNKLYIFLFIFIVGINAAPLVIKKFPHKKQVLDDYKIHSNKADSVQSNYIFSSDGAKERASRFDGIAKKNPVLYIFIALANLCIFLFLLIGIFVDGYLLKMVIKKEPLEIKTHELAHPVWNIMDVVKVSIIFLFLGYVFVLIEVFLIKIFPFLKNENLLMVLNTTAVNTFGIGVIFYFVLKKYKQRLEDLGITCKKFFYNVFYAVVGYLALIPIVLVIMSVTFFAVKWLQYEPPVQPIVELFLLEKQTSVLWISAIFAAIFGPLAEEIFFRAFLYSAVKRVTGALGAIIITSFIFSVLHIHIVGFLPIFVLGFLLSYLYEKTGSLVSSITVHIIHNLAMLLLVFLARAIGV